MSATIRCFFRRLPLPIWGDAAGADAAAWILTLSTSSSSYRLDKYELSNTNMKVTGHSKINFFCRVSESPVIWFKISQFVPFLNKNPQYLQKIC